MYDRHISGSNSKYGKNEELRNLELESGTTWPDKDAYIRTWKIARLRFDLAAIIWQRNRISEQLGAGYSWDAIMSSVYLEALARRIQSKGDPTDSIVQQAAANTSKEVEGTIGGQQNQ